MAVRPYRPAALVFALHDNAFGSDALANPGFELPESNARCQKSDPDRIAAAQAATVESVPRETLHGQSAVKKMATRFCADS